MTNIEMTSVHAEVLDKEESCIMKDGSLDSLIKSVERYADHGQSFEIQVQFRGLTFWNMVPKKTIVTVGNTFTGSGEKFRANIINDLTGRILPKRMTLVMGPPGCGECFIPFCLVSAH
jgi:hypothetical protein